MQPSAQVCCLYPHKDQFMHKRLVVLPVLFCLLLLVNNSQAQVREILESIKPTKKFDGVPAYKKGSHLLFFGAQAPNNIKTFLNFGGLVSLLSSSDSKSAGPFFFGYEYGVRDNLGLGISIQYASALQTYVAPFGIGSITGKISGFAVLFSSQYHIYPTDKLDPYFRGSLGVNIWKGGYQDNNNNEVQKFTAPTPIAYNTSLGLRYFVSKQFAPFGEISYSNLKLTAGIGLCVKLNGIK
jgi:Outer membrane protein beta-barrel domain